MMDRIETFETVLASGQPATVLRISAKDFAVQPLFLSSAGAAETTIARRLGEARLNRQLTAVIPADRRLATPETAELDDLGEVTLYADRAKQSVASSTFAAAPLHLLRLKSADLPHQALLVNASYFLFLASELTAPWDAYGDPLGLVARAGIIEMPPQLKRASLIKDDAGHQLDQLGFADVEIQLPDGAIIAAHPFGKPAAASSDPKAFALFHGSVGGCTPASAGSFDVAYLGRHALAGKKGGEMPIPRAGCVVRFADAGYGRDMASAGPLTYRLGTDPIEAVQAGPQIVREGQSPRGHGNIFKEEGMIDHPDLPDGGVPVSPYDWAADWDATRAARLGAGLSKEGDLFFCAVEGSSSFYRNTANATGATLDDLSRLMIEQGAQEAIHLDGGGSAQVFGTGGGALITGYDVHHGLTERRAQYDRPLPLALRLSF